MTLVQNKKDVFHRLNEYRPAIATFGVRRFGLFGSFVRGVQSPNSDVDMLVEFLPGRKSFDTFMKLSYFLEEIFSAKWTS